MALLPQTEQDYWNLNLNKRKRCYVEDSNQVYLLLGELMLSTDGYEWLGEVYIRNRNNTQSFGNLRTRYDGPGEHLKIVSEANHILENIHYKNEYKAVTFEFCAMRIKE